LSTLPFISKLMLKTLRRDTGFAIEIKIMCAFREVEVN